MAILTPTCIQPEKFLPSSLNYKHISKVNRELMAGPKRPPFHNSLSPEIHITNKPWSTSSLSMSSDSRVCSLVSLPLAHQTCYPFFLSLLKDKRKFISIFLKIAFSTFQERNLSSPGATISLYIFCLLLEYKAESISSFPLCLHSPSVMLKKLSN